MLAHRSRLLLFAFFGCVFTLSGNAWAQDARVGQWTAYVNGFRSLKYDDIAIRGSVVYLMLDNGLLYHDAATDDQKVFTRVDGLSSSATAAMYYDAGTDYVFLAYANGIIDYFRQPDKLQSYRDIFLNSSQTSKRTYNMTANAGLLYIACDFGIVVFDVNRAETRASYLQIGTNQPNSQVSDVAVYDGRVWAATPTGLFSGRIGTNLADPANWRAEANRNGFKLSGAGIQIESTPQQFIAYKTNLLMGYTATNWDTLQAKALGNFTAAGNDITFLDGGNLYRLNPNGSSYTYFYTNFPQTQAFNPENNLVAVVDIAEGLKIQYNGVIKNVGNKTVGTDFCIDLMVTPKDELYVVPTPRYQPTDTRPEMYYLDRAKDKWTIFNFANVDSNFIYTCAYSDDALGKVYAGTWQNGYLEFVDGEFKRLVKQTGTRLTGEQEVAGGPLRVRVTDASADGFGNTWFSQTFLLNNTSNRPFVLYDANNRWYNFTRADGIADNRFLQVEIDPNGYAWFVHRDQGIYVLDVGGTPNNTSDDRWRLIAGGQAGLPSGNVNCLKLDKSGNMWVGTTAGVAVFYNTFEIFNTGEAGNASCPIYNGRCLLKDENIASIEVDGANRKWFATQSGVFYFNPDGTEQLEYFNESNSPLLSDNVYDVAVSNKDGEVFIATENGLIAYRGPVTQPASKNNDLVVFPNPLFTDYDGQVAIRNTTDNATIRIATTSGYLVTELKAAGGQAVWNGRDQQGKKLASGVYVVGAIGADGKNQGTTRMAVIQR
jgi:hypothetical protein